MRGEPTGCPTGGGPTPSRWPRKLCSPAKFSTARRYTVVGRLMPAADSLAQGCLPLGLAHGCSCCARSPRASRSGGATWRSTRARAPCARAARWSRLSARRCGTPLEVLVGPGVSASAGRWRSASRHSFSASRNKAHRSRGRARAICDATSFTISASLNPEAKAPVSTCCGILRSVVLLRPVEALIAPASASDPGRTRAR